MKSIDRGLCLLEGSLHLLFGTLRSRRLLSVATLFASLLVSGCTAINSEAVDENHSPIGVPYFLPRRPFIITISTPTGGGPPAITVAPGNAEPDLHQEYVLSQGINLLAQNEFNIAVASNGLLQSSQSTATSEVSVFVQNAAATAGIFTAPSVASVTGGTPPTTLSPLAEAIVSPKVNNVVECPPEGSSYQYIVYPELNDPVTFSCQDGSQYTVSWVRSDDLEKHPRNRTPYRQNKSVTLTGTVSGIFFRHELPYKVTVLGLLDGHNVATESDFIVTSPDESETDFFPITRNFFANNTAKITATDGVITGVDQTTQSEAAAFVGLPATYLSSYMTAIGQVFSGLTSISANRQALLQQMQATAVTQAQAAAIAAAQYQVCRKTVASFNFANMSTDQASAAAAAIQAACATK